MPPPPLPSDPRADAARPDTLASRTLSLHDSVSLHYRVDGAGSPAWLLFNGASLPLEFWDEVAQGLAAEHTVVRLDQRNAGATRASGTFSLLDVAADAAALLDHLEIEQVIVAGHAWGGRVAQVFARDHPHRVRAMAILGTGGQLPATVPTRVLEQMREASRAGDRVRWEQAMEAAFCADGFAARDPARFARISDRMWAGRQSGKGQARASWDMRIAPSPSYWGRADVPTLLIYGTEDRNGTRENALDLAARMPDARLHFIEQAGHFAPGEKPDAVLALLEDFSCSLAEHGAR